MSFPLELMAYLALLGAWTAQPAHTGTDGLATPPAVFLAAGALGWSLGWLMERLTRSVAAQRDHFRNAVVAIGSRVAIAALAALALIAADWPPGRDYPDGARPDGLGGAGIFLPCLLGLLPYLLVFFCVWWPLYPWFRRTRVGVWTKRAFWRHKLAYELYLLALWIPLLAAAEYLPPDAPLMLPTLLAMAWVAPWGLRRLWGCRPADAPGLAARIADLERRAGAKFHGVYFWEPGGGLTLNAAAVGWLKPFQYLFITRALLERLPAEEFDAVVGHELGHIRHRHLALYLAAGLAVLGGAWELLAAPGIFTLAELVGLEIAGIVVYWRFVFGWLSRRMERQADLFALALCGDRAEPLANALERIASAGGGDRTAHSWHHYGIAERVWFLREAARRPELAARHNEAVASIRRLAWAAALVMAGLWLAGHIGAKRAAGGTAGAPGAITAAASEEETARHWRRLAAALPDDPAPPLALARRIWNRGGEREQALAWAEEARRRARSPEEAERLARLINEWQAIAGVEP